MKRNLELLMNVNAECIYRLGKWGCILTQGVPFGLGMYLIWNALEYLRDRNKLAGKRLVAWLVSFLVFCLAACLVFGWLQWRKIERRALPAQRPS